MDISKEIRKIAESNPHPLNHKILSHLIPLNKKLNFISVVQDIEYLDFAEEIVMSRHSDESFNSTRKNLIRYYPEIEHPKTMNLARLEIISLSRRFKDNELLFFFSKCCVIYILNENEDYIYLRPEDEYKLALNGKYWKQVIQPYFIDLEEALKEETIKNPSKHKILSSFIDLSTEKIKIFQWMKEEKSKRKLFDLLFCARIKGKHIIEKESKYEDFEKLFSTSGEAKTSLKKVNWLKSKRLLAYLVDELITYEYIDDKDFWQRAYNVFLRKSAPITKLDVAKSQYQTENENRKPNFYQTIDSILSELNNTKSPSTPISKN